METDPDLAVAAAGVLLAVLTAAMAAVMTFLTRPRSPCEGPATMHLADEPPPALVDLVTDDFEVTPEAVPATVCDLAARRWLSIEEAGMGNVVIRLRRQDGRGVLAPYERQVLDHLRGLAVGDIVPAKVMTTGPEAASRGWWRRFERAVVADAQARGLCRDRWRAAHFAPVVLGAVASGALLFGAQLAGESRPSAEDMPRDATIAVALQLVGAFMIAGIFWWVGHTRRRGAQRDTDRGLVVGAHWLGVRRWMDEVGDFADKPAASVTLWERYLGYAVALDLARTATHQLPLGAEDDRHAWSRVTGTWRQVRVLYPRLRPGWGQHPVWAALQSIVVGGLAGAAVWFALQARRGQISALDDVPENAQRYVDIGALAVGALGLPVVLWSVLKLLPALADLFTTRTVDGEVLRQRRRMAGDWLPGPLETALFSGGRSRRSRDQREERRYIAVDDGTAPEVRAWKVTDEVYRQCHQGALVRVRYTPRLGRVKSVEVLRSARSSSDTSAVAAAVTPQLASEAAEFLGRVLGGARDRLEAAGSTGATDRDGVPLTERLAEAEQLLDRLRHGQVPVAADEGGSP